MGLKNVIKPTVFFVCLSCFSIISVIIGEAKIEWLYLVGIVVMKDELNCLFLLLIGVLGLNSVW